MTVPQQGRAAKASGVSDLAFDLVTLFDQHLKNAIIRSAYLFKSYNAFVLCPLFRRGVGDGRTSHRE